MRSTLLLQRDPWCEVGSTWSEVAEICCTCSVTNFSRARRSARAAGEVLEYNR